MAFQPPAIGKAESDFVCFLPFPIITGSYYQILLYKVRSLTDPMLLTNIL